MRVPPAVHWREAATSASLLRRATACLEKSCVDELLLLCKYTRELLGKIAAPCLIVGQVSVELGKFVRQFCRTSTVATAEINPETS